MPELPRVPSAHSVCLPLSGKKQNLGHERLPNFEFATQGKVTHLISDYASFEKRKIESSTFIEHRLSKPQRQKKRKFA
jgi:hypothetical protein